MNVSPDKECLPNSYIFKDKDGTLYLYCEKSVIVDGKVRTEQIPSKVSCNSNPQQESKSK